MTESTKANIKEPIQDGAKVARLELMARYHPGSINQSGLSILDYGVDFHKSSVKQYLHCNPFTGHCSLRGCFVLLRGD